jgi:flagellar motor switch protein FliM
LQLLSKQVQCADIELVATLGRANITLEKVLKMRNGDIIPLEVEENITASVDGVPFMECKYGVFNNQYALRIAKMLTSNEGESNV